MTFALRKRLIGPAEHVVNLAVLEQFAIFRLTTGDPWIDPFERKPAFGGGFVMAFRNTASRKGRSPLETSVPPP